jgi:hypothetical protein
MSFDDRCSYRTRYGNNVHNCPEYGSPGGHADEERDPLSPTDFPRAGEDVEPEVRDVLYGWRSGTVKRLAGV